MMRFQASCSLSMAFEKLSVSASTHCSGCIQGCSRRPLPRYIAVGHSRRTFSHTTSRSSGGTWLLPQFAEKSKSPKGRPRVHTGGSSRGTTLVWGNYGLRMKDHHRRVSAAQLKIGEEAIKLRLKGLRYRLYKRVNADQGVYKKGNEVRMGKGKGTFDHWAAKVGVNKIIFELKSHVHEQVIRDAFRIAGNKMPGLYEMVWKGDAPVVGITKLKGVTLDELKRPRRKVPLDSLSIASDPLVQDSKPTTISPVE